MPFPDWVEGKQQFSDYLFISDSGSVADAATQTILDYDGSGEILYCLVGISNLSRISSTNDRFYFYIDGFMAEESWWSYMLQMPVDNSGVLIIPRNFNMFGLGSVFLRRNTQFVKNIKLDYRNTTHATYGYFIKAILGLY